MKIFLIVILIMTLIPMSLSFGADFGTYLGEFCIGESFFDEVIVFPNGSQPKVSIVYRGISTDTLLIYIASSPESTYLIAPGYCVVKKNVGYWQFDFGLGTKDCTFTLQSSTNNKIKIWRK
jgi:hypothetical protein